MTNTGVGWQPTPVLWQFRLLRRWCTSPTGVERILHPFRSFGHSHRTWRRWRTSTSTDTSTDTSPHYNSWTIQSRTGTRNTRTLRAGGIRLFGWGGVWSRMRHYWIVFDFRTIQRKQPPEDRSGRSQRSKDQQLLAHHLQPAIAYFADDFFFFFFCCCCFFFFFFLLFLFPFFFFFFRLPSKRIHLHLPHRIRTRQTDENMRKCSQSGPDRSLLLCLLICTAIIICIISPPHLILTFILFIPLSFLRAN